MIIGMEPVPPSPDMERKLACSVIVMAMRDLVAAYGDKEQSLTQDECHKFLIGGSWIAQHWFAVARIVPMTGTLDDVYERLKDIKCRINTLSGLTRAPRRALP